MIATKCTPETTAEKKFQQPPLCAVRSRTHRGRYAVRDLAGNVVVDDLDSIFAADLFVETQSENYIAVYDLHPEANLPEEFRNEK